MNPELAAVVAAVRAARFRYANEEGLQAGLADVLHVAGIGAEREVRLPEGRGRIDLLTHGRVGIEVKVAGTVADVGRQARRYLKSDWLAALVLVTVVAKHLALDGDSGGKPLVVVSVASSGL